MNHWLIWLWNHSWELNVRYTVQGLCMASNKVRRCGENNSSDLFLLHGSGDPSKTKVNRLRKTKSSSILYIIYFCLRQSISTIFTVGEAVRSTCGKWDDEEEEEEHFLLSLLQAILWWPGVTRGVRSDQVWPGVSDVTSCDQMWPGVTRGVRSDQCVTRGVRCDQLWPDMTRCDQGCKKWPGVSDVTRCDQGCQMWPGVTKVINPHSS